MNLERIHACLDGDLPLDELSQTERARLVELQSAIDSSVAELRGEVAPDLSARVMAQISATPRPAPRASRAEKAAGLLRRLFWEPHTLVFRPVYGWSVAILLAAALFWEAPIDAPVSPVHTAAATAEEPAIYVQFRLTAPEADQVQLAGSFTDWQPQIELHQSAPGVWTAMVPLDPGVHDYTYVVNGDQWVVDFAAPQVDDGFGGLNNQIALLEPETLRS